MRSSSALGWVFVIFAAVLAASRSATRFPGGSPRVASGTLERPKITTGNVPDWVSSRRDAILLALAKLAPPLGDALARRVALSLLAQYAHETARGAREFNFNLGGWLARRGDPFFVARDALLRDVRKFAAFDDLLDAADKQLARLISRFPRAWAVLVNRPESADWIHELKRAGYFEAPADAYVRAWQAHRAQLERAVIA